MVKTPGWPRAPVPTRIKEKPTAQGVRLYWRQSLPMSLQLVRVSCLAVLFGLLYYWASTIVQAAYEVVPDKKGGLIVLTICSIPLFLAPAAAYLWLLVRPLRCEAITLESDCLTYDPGGMLTLIRWTTPIGIMVALATTSISFSDIHRRPGKCFVFKKARITRISVEAIQKESQLILMTKDLPNQRRILCAGLRLAELDWLRECLTLWVDDQGENRAGLNAVESGGGAVG